MSVSSKSSVVQSGDKPNGRIQDIVETDEYTAIIYNPEPESVQEVVKQTRHVKKSLRTSMLASATAPGDQSDSEETSEEEEVYWNLRFFAASLMCTIVEDALIQLQILIECNSEMRVIKTMADLLFHKATKYGVEKAATTDELAGIDPKKLYCLEYKLNKLNADRDQILNLFINLYIELAINKSFAPIIDFSQTIIFREERYKNLMEEEVKNKAIRKELIKQLRQQRNQQKTSTYEINRIISGLRLQIEDQVLLSETKSRYVTNWQAARTEQHEVIISDNEYMYTSSSELYKKKFEQESRVHAEVEFLTNIIIDETLRKVEDWMDKYEIDMEAMDLKIQIQRSEHAVMKEKRIAMEKQFADHAKAMKEWNHFKEERAKAQKYHNDMMSSAIIVQAWWRGLLVRKQLGPFRPKRGKGGSKKK